MAQFSPRLFDLLSTVMAGLKVGHRDEPMLEACLKAVEQYIRRLMTGIQFNHTFLWEQSGLQDELTALLAFREYADQEWLKCLKEPSSQHEPFIGWLMDVSGKSDTSAKLAGTIGSWVRRFVQREAEKNSPRVSSVYKNISGRLHGGKYAEAIHSTHGKVFGLPGWVLNEKGVASPDDVRHALIRLERETAPLPEGRIKRGTIVKTVEVFFSLLDRFATKADFLWPLVMTITGVPPASMSINDPGGDDDGGGPFLALSNPSAGFTIHEEDLLNY